MTDRELLELAAKAAGIKARFAPDGVWRDCTGRDDSQNIFTAPRWNPLTDDGDAFRLAVKLGICLFFLFSTIKGGFSRGVSARRLEVDIEEWGDHINAATRRAIVRAAAEIGRTK